MAAAALMLMKVTLFPRSSLSLCLCLCLSLSLSLSLSCAARLVPRMCACRQAIEGIPAAVNVPVKPGAPIVLLATVDGKHYSAEVSPPPGVAFTVAELRHLRDHFVECCIDDSRATRALQFTTTGPGDSASAPSALR